MTTGIPAALVEQVEAEAYAEFTGAPSAATKAVLGTRQLRIGGGVAIAPPNDRSRYWSLVLGLGCDERVTGSLVERIIEFYEEQGISGARMMIAPQALPADWADICARLGISEGSAGNLKLVGDLSAVGEEAAPVRLDVGLRVAPARLSRCGSARGCSSKRSGSRSTPSRRWPLGVYGKPGWQSFAVFEGDAIVAAANLYLYGSVASLFGCATLPGARRRGAQSALIAARIDAARAAGDVIT